MKPFAVVDSAGGTVFSTEIAKRKIVMAFGSTGSHDGQPRAAAVPLHRQRRRPPGEERRRLARQADRGQEGPVRRRPRLPDRRPGSSVSSTPSPRRPGARHRPRRVQGRPRQAGRAQARGRGRVDPAGRLLVGRADRGGAGAGADARREAQGRRRHLGHPDGEHHDRRADDEGRHRERVLSPNGS